MTPTATDTFDDFHAPSPEDAEAVIGILIYVTFYKSRSVTMKLLPQASLILLDSDDAEGYRLAMAYAQPDGMLIGTSSRFSIFEWAFGGALEASRRIIEVAITLHYLYG